MFTRFSSYYEKILARGEVKCIDDELPFTLPDSWSWCRLIDVGITETGTTPSKTHPEYFGDYIPFLGPANILEDKVISVTQGLSEIGMGFGRVIPSGSILQVCIGGSIGKCAIVNREVTFNQQINSITPIECNIEYVHYVLQSETFRLSIMEKATGTATPIINRGNWERLLFPLPPTSEQERIVVKLHELTEYLLRYTNAQSSLDDFNTAINIRLRKSILQEAIQGKLVPQDTSEEPVSVLLQRIKEEKLRLVKEGKLKKKDVVDSVIYKGDDNKYYEQIDGTAVLIESDYDFPSTWEVVRLSHICRLIDGEKKEGQYVCLDAKYLRGKSTGNHLNSGKFVTKGDNIILVDGENSGEVFAVPHDGYMGSTFKQLWVSEDMHLPYVLYFIQFYKEKLRNSKKGAAIPHLNKEVFYSLLIGIPPYKEQIRIVNKIDIATREIKG